MTISNTHICTAQDAYTGQFHAVSMEVYRDIYEGRQYSQFYTGHCGIIDRRRKAAVLFIDGDIPKEDFENFVQFCTHILKVAPSRVTKMVKPNIAKANEMIVNMIDQFIQEINEELTKKMRPKDNGDPFGEVGYEDFRDQNGNDTWDGGPTA